MQGNLKQLMQIGAISPLSYFFARFVCQKYQRQENTLLAWSAALVSERNQRGDVCVDLRHHAGKPLFELNEENSEKLEQAVPLAPALPDWIARLQKESAIATTDKQVPLILDRQRLYLARFHHYEKQVQKSILARLAPISIQNIPKIQAGLCRLFPKSTQLDDQKLATALAVSQRFAVLSGGPGTGKTTTLIKVLTLLLEQDPQMRIQLAAPTGKAAARMLESIHEKKAAIDTSELVRTGIPEQASTLHRLLGYDGQRFRRNRENPLLLDCLVIDEASMIDLTLMARLLDALPPKARLLLLGDRDQLASVEAGNVMGDITGHGQTIQYTPEQAKRLAQMIQVPVGDLPVKQQAPQINNAIALLRTSYRFKKDSSIGRLANLVQKSQGHAAFRLIQQNRNKQITWIEATDEHTIAPKALDWAIQQYKIYLQCQDVLKALKAFEQIRILAALHQGPFGVANINQKIAECFRTQSLISGGEDYHGKPILITVNDYEIELYNGDIGLLWRNENGDLRAWFRQTDNQVRSIPVRSLPQHLPAWALTIHKSQGSEFKQVLLVLPPDSNNPILSRELIYTGITRARNQVILHGTEAAWVAGCKKRVERSSGLAEKLGWL